MLLLWVTRILIPVGVICTSTMTTRWFHDIASVMLVLFHANPIGFSPPSFVVDDCYSVYASRDSVAVSPITEPIVWCSYPFFFFLATRLFIRFWSNSMKHNALPPVITLFPLSFSCWRQHLLLFYIVHLPHLLVWRSIPERQITRKPISLWTRYNVPLEPCGDTCTANEELCLELNNSFSARRLWQSSYRRFSSLGSLKNERYVPLSVLNVPLSAFQKLSHLKILYLLVLDYCTDCECVSAFHSFGFPISCRLTIFFFCNNILLLFHLVIPDALVVGELHSYNILYDDSCSLPCCGYTV